MVDISLLEVDTLMCRTLTPWSPPECSRETGNLVICSCLGRTGHGPRRVSSNGLPSHSTSRIRTTPSGTVFHRPSLPVVRTSTCPFSRVFQGLQCPELVDGRSHVHHEVTWKIFDLLHLLPTLPLRIPVVHPPPIVSAPVAPPDPPVCHHHPTLSLSETRLVTFHTPRCLLCDPRSPH